MMQKEIKKDVIWGLALATGLSFAAGCTQPDKENDRPNLIFIFTDQQSSDMLGCYGNREIITPRIDAFAGQAVRFSHCVANCPVCTPLPEYPVVGTSPAP
jgi:hypothetical protein